VADRIELIGGRPGGGRGRDEDLGGYDDVAAPAEVAPRSASGSDDDIPF
jgi:hypothetical protein